MDALNSNQKRYVLSTFSYVDGLLRAVEEVADAAPSPFSREHPDLTETEVRLLRSFIATARGRMLEALDRLDIQRPTPSIPARWSVLTKLMFVDVGLSELEGKRLRGYGAADEEAVAMLEALAADLRTLVDRGQARIYRPPRRATPAASAPGDCTTWMNSRKPPVRRLQKLRARGRSIPLRAMEK